jgi:hypothetical protein
MQKPTVYLDTNVVSSYWYLLTWNHAHLANAVAQERLAEVCENMGIACPLLVSPDTIPKVALGQPIRRPRHGRD